MNRDSRANTKYSAICRLLSAFVAIALLTSPAQALTVAQKKQIARTQFENAERMREALNGRPAKDRKIADYKKVIEAYRKVYYTAPTSTKADASVAAVAELLVEQGRTFKSTESLTNAIGQYEFLRKEYPGSKYRVEALFTIAQIYRDDLNDNAKAKETLQEFVKRYPNTELIADARAALKEIEDEEAQAAKAASAKTRESVKPAAEKQTGAADKKATVAEVSAEPADRPATRTLVTGVRHWSTPDYTRIAIDLEQEIQYDFGRIPNPDRIYFDLKDTKLSSVLKGKTLDVDDGFLKKIRVGQFAPGLTRVVLEVGDDVGDYSAFLLPNPYRLIIDIHGNKPTKLMARTQQPRPTSEPAGEKKAVADKKPTAAAKKSAPATEPSSKTETAAKATENPAEKKTEVAKLDTPKQEASKPQPREETTKATETSTAQVPREVPTRIVEPDPEPKSPEPKKTETVAKSEPPVSKETASKHEEPPIRVRGKKRQAPEKLAARTAKPTTDGERSLIRALGLKIGRIVVDAGHGGHDTGTIGPNGLMEKDLVLDVALRLGKALEQRLGAEVVYTRDDDTFIPLETRTAIANQQQADLFISVHANSSRDESARGVETYYLNFTSSRDALEVAARENAVSEKSIHELQDLVKKIALKEKIEESREFALDVQSSLHAGLAAKAPAIRNRGVKKAPFIVLIGANMPSILAEISFISNPTDEKRLQSTEYRQKIADSLYKGVSKYIGGLSGVKVATKMAEGQ
ncbi:MAG TPA: N-acetylmuramoyl-L-alanine amidase [Terriglobales bacterium]|nr:N-acetylmuramoyl-L-alanine amidase [Terriglobales bacterium]